MMGLIGKIFTKDIVATLFPHFTCMVCRTELNGDTAYICGACADKLPKYVEAPKQKGCKATATIPTKIIAPFLYANPVDSLIMRFKYNAEGDIAKLFAPYMVGQIIKGKSPAFDYLIPVPLSAERFKQRGYNQALLLANEISKLTGIPVADIMIRTKKTTPQKNMTSEQRRENLAGAFCINDSSAVKGKRVLLIDDVYTTGATAGECIMVLRKAGAKSVKTLVIARTASARTQKTDMQSGEDGRIAPSEEIFIDGG